MLTALLAAILPLGAVPADSWALKGNAHLVDDGGRPAAQLRVVSYYNQQPAGYLATRTFATYLTQYAGRSLEFCVRARATKDGSVEVDLGDGFQPIPFTASDRYATRCVPFTAEPLASVWITNDGIEGNVTRIRHAFIREGVTLRR
jgi:hypothetical protein